MRRYRHGRVSLRARLLIAAVLAASPVAGAAQVTPESLYQAALYQEEVAGDLEQAIALYQQILDADTDHATAARATLHIGLCYEKLGLDRAREAYRRVIEGYPDQREVVAVARERLAAMVAGDPPAEPGGVRARLVWGGGSGTDVDPSGGPMPDGRGLVYIDWETGNLAVRDLGTGESRLLTDDGCWDAVQRYPVNAIVSPDGSLVAYSWIEAMWGKDPVYELRVVDTRTSARRTLLTQRGSSDAGIFPFAWSPRGTEVFLGRYDPDPESSGVSGRRAVEFGTIPAMGGELRSLVQFDSAFWAAAVYAPDGRSIAMAHPVTTDSGRYDITLIAESDGERIPAVRHPSNDLLLGWLPGTDQLLFRSDRSGSWDLWAVQIGPNGAVGPPRPVQRRIGEINALGFARDGTLFYSKSTRWFETRIAPFDPGTGDVSHDDSDAVLGSIFNLAWSPDGRRLAYIQETTRPRGSFHVAHEVGVRDLVTGQERPLGSGLAHVGDPTWHPDGRSILVTATEAAQPEELQEEAFYRVDASTGAATKLLQVPDEGRWWLGEAAWGPGGDAILYTLFETLIRRDLATGTDSVLFRNPHLAGQPLAPSPDGEWIAVGIVDSTAWSGHPHATLEGGGRIVLVPTGGGTPREVARISEPGRVERLDWVPDGSALFFVQRGDSTHSLWRAPVTGAGAEKLWEREGWVVDFAIHPDGRRVAYTGYTQETEVWALDGLPGVLGRP